MIRSQKYHKSEDGDGKGCPLVKISKQQIYNIELKIIVIYVWCVCACVSTHVCV